LKQPKKYILEKILALLAFIIFIAVLTLLGLSNSKPSEAPHISNVSNPDKDIIWKKYSVANFSFSLPNDFKYSTALSSSNQKVYMSESDKLVGFTIDFNELPNRNEGNSIRDFVTDIQDFGKSVNEGNKSRFDDFQLIEVKYSTLGNADAIEVNQTSKKYPDSNVEMMGNANFIVSNPYNCVETFSYPKHINISTKEVIDKIKRSYEFSFSNNITSEEQAEYQMYVKNLNRNSYLKNLTDENIITQFIYAENSNDWERIMFLLSQNMQVFWGKSNPSYSDIYSAYKKRFDNYSDDFTDILEIKPIGNKEYQVDVKYYSQNKVHNNSIIFKLSEKAEIVYIDEA